jgi:hypothetical protein
MAMRIAEELAGIFFAIADMCPEDLGRVPNEAFEAEMIKCGGNAMAIDLQFEESGRRFRMVEFLNGRIFVKALSELDATASEQTANG